MPNDSGQFELERDLVEALRRNVAQALRLTTRWFDVRSEVTVRTRIADLLLIHASSAPDSSPTRVSYFEAAILAALLKGGSAPVGALAERFYANRAAIESRAGRLARLGLINVDEEGTLHASGAPDDVRIVAIEAKLSRWRSAVTQATRYRDFANQAYIAMPAPVFDRTTEVLDACLHAGIGALAAMPDGNVIVILEAPETNPQSAEWVRVVSGFVGFRAVRKRSRPRILMREAAALVERPKV